MAFSRALRHVQSVPPTRMLSVALAPRVHPSRMVAHSGLGGLHFSCLLDGRHHVAGRSFCNQKMPNAYDVDDDEDIPAPKVLRIPRRRWMSVTDLVSEVEQGLVKGERLEKGGTAYENLQREATRLRMDNDTIMSDSEKLAAERGLCVRQEEDIYMRMSMQPGDVGDLAALASEVTERIKGFDTRLAALRHQQVQNIKDVGSLKRTMSLIEKTAEVGTLVDRVEASCKPGRTRDAQENDAETAALSELAEHLRDEYQRASQKALVYERKISELLQSPQVQTMATGSFATTHGEGIDTLSSKFYKAKRMLAQLSRLVDIQMTNAESISLLERSHGSLERHRDIHSLVQTEDVEKLVAKAQFLKEENERVRRSIKDIESGLDKHIQEAVAIIDKLRNMRDLLTPETGKLREQLIANIHQKEQWKVRLAVLRGEKVQNLRFLTMVQAALAGKQA